MKPARFTIRLAGIGSVRDGRAQIERIGSDRVGVGLMFRKTRTLGIKVHDLKLPQVHILKEEMLAIGADAAVSRGVLVGACERSDVLLIGTVKQLHELVRRLPRQQFSMKQLANQIGSLLAHLEHREMTWKVKGRDVILGPRTLVMGVLNVTPDSFSDGGRYADTRHAVEHARELVRAGADIIDVGGESTRPGADFVPADDEKSRVIPVIEAIRAEHPDILISVDTYKAAVAEAAVAAGADIINDISGLSFDERMASVVAATGAGYVMMHTRATPDRMQADTSYADFMGELIRFFEDALDKAAAAGIPRDAIVIDPGIGFAKTADHNLSILKHLVEFATFGLPVLVGPSRKAFIGLVTGRTADRRVDGTLAAVTAAVLHGAHIVRVHDVMPCRDAVLVADAIRNAEIL